MPRARFDPPLVGLGQMAASLSEPVARGMSEPVARGMSEPVARGISEPVARGIGQLSQATIHAADSWTLKSPTPGPNNAPAMVSLAETFTLFKALLKIAQIDLNAQRWRSAPCRWSQFAQRRRLT
jgi:hypothetical protein